MFKKDSPESKNSPSRQPAGEEHRSAAEFLHVSGKSIVDAASGLADGIGQAANPALVHSPAADVPYAWVAKKRNSLIGGLLPAQEDMLLDSVAGTWRGSFQPGDEARRDGDSAAPVSVPGATPGRAESEFAPAQKRLEQEGVQAPGAKQHAQKGGRKVAVIIGAGPAGLTAAYELLKRTGMYPIIIEKTDSVGGFAKTMEIDGNRFDIGGHRFRMDSGRVAGFMREIMPVEDEGGIAPPDPRQVMTKRDRHSRIYWGGGLYEYPFTLGHGQVFRLGPARAAKIMCSYLYARLLGKKDIVSLEDFYISRFGFELYKAFFEGYTTKIWGVPCSRMSPEWGMQRVRDLNFGKAILNAFARALGVSDKTNAASSETFYYPGLGPGQFWDEVAGRVEEMGGEFHFCSSVTGITTGKSKVRGVTVRSENGQEVFYPADCVFSSMPVPGLISAFDNAPASVRQVAAGLTYRDFVTIGVKLRAIEGDFPDNWIYIQDENVRAVRVQFSHNWSPGLLASPNTRFVTLEYFCNEGDSFWNSSDDTLAELAASELAILNIAKRANILGTVVARIPKAYPAYSGSYEHFSEISGFTDKFANLFLVGRNGQHRYNDMSRSILTSMNAVDNIIAGRSYKRNVWAADKSE